MIDLFLSVIDSFSSVQLYLVIFVSALIESFPFLGIIFPGTLFLIIGGILVSQGYINWIVTVLIMNLGFILGDLIGYFIGRFHLQRFCVKDSFIFNTKQLDKCKAYFRAHGGKSVFTGRFIGFIRPFLSITAGMGHMSFSRFLFYTISSVVIWSGAYFFIGYLIGNFDLAVQVSSYFTMTTTIIVSSIMVIFLVLYVMKHESVLYKLKHLKLQDWLMILFLILFSVLFVFTLVVALPHKTASHLIIQRTPILNSFMIFITDLAGYRFLSIFMLLLSICFLIRKKFVMFYSFSIAFIMSGFFVEIIKRTIKSDRPNPLNALVDTYGYSFPSGHSTMAVVVYGLIAYFIIRYLNNGIYKIGVLFFTIILILTIGISRIYLGAHWPIDVFGGYMLGGACLSAVVCVNEYRLKFKNL